jgi:hypothetical protein
MASNRKLTVCVNLSSVPTKRGNPFRTKRFQVDDWGQPEKAAEQATDFWTSSAFHLTLRELAMSNFICRRLPPPYGRFLLASITVAATFIASPSLASGGERNPLVGTWRFTTFVDTPDGGQPVYAFGKDPIGFFVFTVDGHVFLNLMRNPPSAPLDGVDSDPDSCLPDWFCAYFGTYTVDTKKGVWVTHVLGSNMPNYLGTDQTRSFTLRGDKLVISESYFANGKRVQADRILIRELGSR